MAKAPVKGGDTKGLRSIKTAANKGLGGGLLLGFSTCTPGGAAGQTYVAPLHRLRGVHVTAGEVYFHFEPLSGTVKTLTDVIKMTIADEYSVQFWITVANVMGGKRSGDTFIWLYNECATDQLAMPQTINNVTAITITLAAS